MNTVKLNYFKFGNKLMNVEYFNTKKYLEMQVTQLSFLAQNQKEKRRKYKI